MKKTVILLLAVFLITPTHNASASSLWGKLKKRVENEVENVVTGKVARKAGDKAGEATDAVLNNEAEQVDGVNQPSLEPSRSKNKNAESNAVANNPLGNLGGMGGIGSMLNAMQQEVSIDDRYSFDFSVSAENTYGKNKSLINQKYSSSAFMIDDDKGNQIIMDLTNQAIVMLDNKAKTQSAMSAKLIQQMSEMGGSQFQAANKTSTVDIANIKKTGESKEIAGYRAEQWVFEGESNRGEVWFTNKVDFDFVDFTKQLSQVFGGKQSRAMFDFSSIEGDYPRGVIMESKTYENSELESHYLVTKLNRKSTDIDLSGYAAKTLMQGSNN